MAPKSKSKSSNPWMTALKKWNQKHGKVAWCIPKKGSREHQRVKDESMKIKAKISGKPLSSSQQAAMRLRDADRKRRARRK